MKIIDADAMMEDISRSIDNMACAGIQVDGSWLWMKLNDAIDNAEEILPPCERCKRVHLYMDVSEDDGK